MKISDFFKKIPKIWQSHSEYGYKLLRYANEKESELIWNGTNLKPPNYVLTNKGNEKLYLKEVMSAYSNYKDAPCMRYFTYQTEEDYIKKKDNILKTYWNNNLFNCNELYRNYQEYYKYNKGEMKERKIKLVKKEI